MNKSQGVVIVGAGVFGLSTALELSRDGYTNITILDRHVPPIPDGSSSDISRIIRFDYADPSYVRMAKEAYDIWSSPSSTFNGAFYKTPFILTGTNDAGRAYIQKCTSALTQESLPWRSVKDTAEVRSTFPGITGPLCNEGFQAYYNMQAGWADASLAMTMLRDKCIDSGVVSFVSGPAGTVTGFDRDADGKITAARTLAGKNVSGDLFILSAGAWTSGIVPMHNTVLSTAQVIGYIRLTNEEADKYRNLPIYIDITSGWFCFPPHPGTNYLKVAVHGWGYTRTTTDAHADPVNAGSQSRSSAVSSPSSKPRHARPNFAPEEAKERLRDGLKQVLPEFASKDFERLALCWYTDTPTGDFIVDYHPDSPNLFLATGGSGHAFKFLPVLGKYVKAAMEGTLPEHLAQKWRFRREYKGSKDVFKGDGSRGGPVRREFTAQEKAHL